ncbi:MAG: HD domain-containing protein [Dehalococcoidia bacterium]|nr:HD domain-containing protein [Dehalococcoidia bacterium]
MVCGKVIPQRAVFCPECGEKQLQEVMAQMDQLGRAIESGRTADVSSRVTTAIRKALDATVNAVTVIGEKRDPYTAGHQRRVTALALAIAHDMNLPQTQIDGLNIAGQLHDIGKIAIPSDILNKPGKLSDGEMIVIRGHSQVSYDILKGIEFPWPVAQIAYQHHERLNGSGYPVGIKGKDILLEAKILCVADVVEAMASHRPYRPALGVDKALGEIVKNKGKLYDPDVVDSCVRLFKDSRFSFD